MQEALFSLMQMAKTSAALARLAAGAPAVHLGDDRPDHRRRFGESCDARRPQHRRAARAHRLRRSARHPADRARDAARRLPAQRVPARARRARHDRRPARHARQASRAAAPAAEAARARRRAHRAGTLPCARSPTGSSCRSRCTRRASTSGSRASREVGAAARAARGRSIRVITVGGTNGKGSTVAHLEALLRAHGRATGRVHLAASSCATTSASASTAGEADDAALIAAFERIEAARGADHADLLRVQRARGAGLFRPARRRGRGARGRARRPARCHQHHRRRRRGRRLGRLRSSRLARRRRSERSAREGRHLSCTTGPQCLAAPTCRTVSTRPSRASRRAPASRSATSAGACTPSDGTTRDCPSHSPRCRHRRSQARSSTATPPPHSQRSRRCAVRSAHARAVGRRCGTGAVERAPRRALPDRAGRTVSGFSTSRTTSRRRAPWRSCCTSGRNARCAHARGHRRARRQGCARDRARARGRGRLLDRVRAPRRARHGCGSARQADATCARQLRACGFGGGRLRACPRAGGERGSHHRVRLAVHGRAGARVASDILAALAVRQGSRAWLSHYPPPSWVL